MLKLKLHNEFKLKFWNLPFSISERYKKWKLEMCFGKVFTFTSPGCVFQTLRDIIGHGVPFEHTYRGTAGFSGGAKGVTGRSV